MALVAKGLLKGAIQELLHSGVDPQDVEVAVDVRDHDIFEVGQNGLFFRLLFDELLFCPQSLLDFLPQLAAELLQFLFSMLQPLGVGVFAPGIRVASLKVGDKGKELIGMPPDEPADPLGELAAKGHEQFRVFAQVSGQGIDPVMGERGVFPPFKLAQVGVVKADAGGHGSDGIV